MIKYMISIQNLIIREIRVKGNVYKMIVRPALMYDFEMMAQTGG